VASEKQEVMMRRRGRRMGMAEEGWAQ